jgi:hypothetical protein
MALKQVTKKTGWSVSSILKRGVLVLRDEVGRNSRQSAFDIYRQLDIGSGGYAAAPSTETRRGMQLKPKTKSWPMILVGTGPFVSLFDPQDSKHKRCQDILSTTYEPLLTTLPVSGDHPMGLADGSIVIGVESLRSTKIFTLDQAGFRRYRIHRGHHHMKVNILG